jgi:hypothetical protein
VFTAKTLDYETRQTYSLEIQASDSGISPANTATTILTVNVQNVNEQTPSCPANTMFANVAESVAIQPAVVSGV